MQMQRVRWYILAGLFIVGSFGGCKCRGGTVVGGVAVPPPTVDDVPAQTTSATLTITGTKTRGTTAWIQFDYDNDAQQTQSSSDDEGFSRDVTLRVGMNRFVAFASKGDKLSTLVGPYEIEVISSVPAPTIDAVATPTNMTPQTVTGTKTAGTSVHLVRNADTSTVLDVSPEDSSTTWSYDLPLSRGSNGFYVFARRSDSLLPSLSVSASIDFDDVPPAAPTVNTPVSPTGDASQTLSGTRPADGNLCLRRDTQPVCTEILPEDGGTSFSVPTDLNDGTNALCFSSVDLFGNQSDEVCVYIDKVPGPAVTVVSPQANGTVSGSSTDVLVDVVGGSGPGEDVTNVEICIETDCQTVTSGTERYTRTLDTSGFVEGQSYTIEVRATNSAGGVTVTQVVVFYSASGGFLVSNTSAPGHATEVSIAEGPAGVLHVVWADECIQFGIAECPESQAGNEPYDIFYRRFDGSDWDPTVTLISDDANDGDSRQPSVAVDSSGNVHIVWQDSGDIDGANTGADDTDLFHRVIDGSGLGVMTLISDNVLGDRAPQLAATSDGSVHLVWEQRQSSVLTEVYYREWTGTWGSSVLLSGSGDARVPRVVGDSTGNAHVVWQEEVDDGGGASHTDVFYRKVIAGAADATTYTVSDINRALFPGNGRSPAISVDSAGNAHVAWVDSSNVSGAGATDNDIFYRTYAAGGGIGAKLLVSQGSDVGSDTPEVVATGADIATVIWAEPQGGGNADLNFRQVNGGIVGDSDSPAANSGLSVSPRAVSVGGSLLHVVWQDATRAGAEDETRAGAVEDDDILYIGYPL